MKTENLLPFIQSDRRQIINMKIGGSIMRYSFYYDQLDDVMYDFLRTCCNCWDFDHLLENFTQGVGCLLNEIGIAFADDPDENDPTQIRDFPELEGFEGVEIYDNFGNEIMVGD